MRTGRAFETRGVDEAHDGGGAFARKKAKSFTVGIRCTCAACGCQYSERMATGGVAHVRDDARRRYRSGAGYGRCCIREPERGPAYVCAWGR